MSIGELRDIMPRPELLDWWDGETVRPYVFMREGNRIQKPGTLFDVEWFPFEPVYFNALRMDEVSKADQILNLEHKAFQASGMAMPRWVFYDCAIMPGFVAGFAQKTKTLPKSVQKALGHPAEREWTPISLFIIIPTMAPGEWTAHNLSSVNSLIPRKDRYYGLGFLTKAFGLWYANIEVCCGMTQWESPAIRLHSQYGPFEVLTAYTPAHSYPRTLTYRLKVDPLYWPTFFNHQSLEAFNDRYRSAGFEVDPTDENSLKSFQSRIEANEGPFYLSAHEMRTQSLTAPFQVYQPVES